MPRFDMSLTVYPSSPGRDEKIIFFSTEDRTAELARREAIATSHKNGRWVRNIFNFRRRRNT